MKNIYSNTHSLKDYKKYQQNIGFVSIGEKVNLKILQKENGYQDVFGATEDDKLIGELFPSDSRELFNFVKFPEHFQVDSSIKKILSKEDDMHAVVLRIDISCLDDFDYEFFLENQNKSNFEKAPVTEEVLLEAPVKKKKNGCFKAILVIFAIFFILIYIMGKCSS